MRYLVGGYGGQLSARGEVITLSNAQGMVIDNLDYPGGPTPGQSFLRVAEILYAPLDPTSAELESIPGLSASDFEFIELVNTGTESLALGGAQFVDGVTMTFGAGIDLAAGERLLVVANLAAFELRYGTDLPVAGEYSGNLSNGGESIQIIDPAGENVLEFSYDGSWFPTADDQGHSLIMIDPAGTPFTDFDVVRNWGVSRTVGGDPGVGSGSLAMTYRTWKYSHFTDEQLDNLAVSGDEVDFDGDTLTTLFEYALGLDPLVADDDPGYGVSIEEIAGVERQVLSHRIQASAIDLTVMVEACDDLVQWVEQTGLAGDPVDNGDGTVLLKIFDSEEVSGSIKRFMRLKVRVNGSN